MAVNLSEVMRNSARTSAPVVPRHSPTVLRGSRSVGRISGKLWCGLIKYDAGSLLASTAEQGAGLRNLGNTRFLNSTLQCPTYTAPLAAYLQSGKHQNTCRTAGFFSLCAIQKHVSRALQSTGNNVQVQERDYTGTAYVPVYVMLPLGTINMDCELVNPDNLIDQLRILKSIKVDGVMVDCWWGIVEAHYPQQYNWSGYKKLFQIVRDLDLKLQVVMSFHGCGGNVGDDVHIPLPQWIMEIGSKNPDIFFTDKDGRPNHECLTWGIDKEPVLRGRSALEVYYDYMKSFCVEFNELLAEGIISEIEIGLGPCGELRYPSYAANHGWKYPGIGEFQCYDKYLVDNFKKATESRGHPIWNRAPDNTGSCNSKPYDTKFFSNGGGYDSLYGKFFLKWYSGVLLDHADQVLAMANIIFEETPIAAKLPGIHWWFKTLSHAAELTAGFNHSTGLDGYTPILLVLKKRNATLNFTCIELRTMDQEEEALADPEGLVWKVMTSAWEVGVPFASENALPCYSKQGYDKILDTAKHIEDPPLTVFTYLRLCPELMEEQNLSLFENFIQRMHGESGST